MKLQGRDNRGRSAGSTLAPPKPRQREFARSDDGALLVLGCLFFLVGSVGWFSAGWLAAPNPRAAAEALSGPASSVPELGVIATWLVGGALLAAAFRARRAHRSPNRSGSGELHGATPEVGGVIAVDWDRAVDGRLVIRADSLGGDAFESRDVARALSAAGCLARSQRARLTIGGHEPGRLGAAAGVSSGGSRKVPAPASLRRATWAMAAVATLTTAQLTSVLLTHLSPASDSLSIGLVIGVAVVLGLISLTLATRHSVLELQVEPQIELQVEKRALGICWQRQRFAAGSWVHPLLDAEHESGLLWLCSAEHSLVVATTSSAAEELGRWLQGNAASAPSPPQQAYGLTHSPLMSNDE